MSCHKGAVAVVSRAAFLALLLFSARLRPFGDSFRKGDDTVEPKLPYLTAISKGPAALFPILFHYVLRSASFDSFHKGDTAREKIASPSHNFHPQLS